MHAGAIPSTGGQVSVTIQPAQGSYASTTRNGVTTYSYGNWSGSISLSWGSPSSPTRSWPRAWSKR
ncbi:MULTISPECIES: LCCL domain-containing protein [unclassified Myxococcus]|uniref:LCCL domain-containing protein n=1 Tax=unclassified Myxococcus TaxID=2648731 RepID=UPI001E368661|nr:MULTISPECIES: LCCL domain-containing protein [unclassified Myxococcus]